MYETFSTAVVNYIFEQKMYYTKVSENIFAKNDSIHVYAFITRHKLRTKTKNVYRKVHLTPRNYSNIPS